MIINYAKDYPNNHYYAKAYHMQWASTVSISSEITSFLAILVIFSDCSDFLKW